VCYFIETLCSCPASNFVSLQTPDTKKVRSLLSFVPCGICYIVLLKASTNHQEHIISCDAAHETPCSTCKESSTLCKESILCFCKGTAAEQAKQLETVLNIHIQCCDFQHLNMQELFRAVPQQYGGDECPCLAAPQPAEEERQPAPRLM
jgi:hypothetical protein